MLIRVSIQNIPIGNLVSEVRDRGGYSSRVENLDYPLSQMLSYLGTRRWYLYLREVSIYSNNERAPAMPNQTCFRHIEAIIPTIPLLEEASDG